jgi:hypothetical protein
VFRCRLDGRWEFVALRKYRRNEYLNVGNLVAFDI